MDAAHDERSKGILRQVLALEAHQRAQFLADVCADDDALRIHLENRLGQDVRKLLLTVAADCASAAMELSTNHHENRRDAETAMPFDFVESSKPNTPESELSSRKASDSTDSTRVDQTDRYGAPAVEQDRYCLSEPEVTAAGEIGTTVGHQIGPYQIVAQIGAGVIGTVYQVKEIGEFTQKIAVKLINRALDDDMILGRFQTEVHVQTALGRHPNITTFLDAGRTADGRSYLVMECVTGLSIDKYCDSRQLDIPSRLKLFGQVCEAVHFAHQNAVIHCDLKPSNILLTPDGVPRLTDFGITRLIDAERDRDDDPEIDATGTSKHAVELPLAPEYTSPEQVKGEPVTTASDVYALGIILYWLLTGRSPYRLNTNCRFEVFQAICEQVPEKPSTVVIHSSSKELASSTSTNAIAAPVSPHELSTEPVLLPTPASTLERIAAARSTLPKQLARILVGDLDMIVLKALRKDPERRYASAEQFADDVYRYLKGLPVRAHDDTLTYHTVKFVQRHVVSLTTALVFALVLSAVIAGITIQVIRTRSTYKRTAGSFRQAQKVIDQFFTHVSEGRLLNQTELSPLRTELLQDAKEFYEDFLRQRAGDSSVRVELAAARARVAKITSLTGSTAETVLQYQQAIPLWESLVANQPGNMIYRENLARTLHEFGVILMPSPDRGAEALRVLGHAQNLIEALASEIPHSVSIRRELGLLLQNMARVEYDHGQSADAIKNLQRSLEIESELAKEDPHAIDPIIAMAKADRVLGQILIAQADGLEPALATYQQSVALLESVIRDHPELADQAYELAMILSDLTLLQQTAGKLDSALVSSQRALAIFERLDRQHPEVLNYQRALGRMCNVLSDIYRHRREPDESFAFAQKARALFEQLASENAKDISSRIDLAKSHSYIGRILQQTGEPVDALRSFQRAVDLYESIPNLDPRDNYNLACNLSLCIPLIGTRNGSQGTLDTLRLSDSDRLRRQVYGDRAVEVLRRTVGTGIFNARALQSDPDVDSIRDRADFETLIKDVEKNDSATARN
jgi:serine/threonine protein kinase